MDVAEQHRFRYRTDPDAAPGHAQSPGRDQARGPRQHPLATRPTQGPAQPSPPEAGVGDDDDRADPPARVDDHRELDTGLDQQHHPLPGSHAGRGQGRGRLVHPPVEVGEGDRGSVDLDHGRRVVAAARLESPRERRRRPGGRLGARCWPGGLGPARAGGGRARVAGAGRADRGRTRLAGAGGADRIRIAGAGRAGRDGAGCRRTASGPRRSYALHDPLRDDVGGDRTVLGHEV